MHPRIFSIALGSNSLVLESSGDDGCCDQALTISQGTITHLTGAEVMLMNPGAVAAGAGRTSVWRDGNAWLAELSNQRAEHRST